MHSLPILLITLALLPLSAALKCHFEIKTHNDDGKPLLLRYIEQCKIARYCVKSTGKQDGLPMTMKFCDERNMKYGIKASMCDEEQCIEGEADGDLMTVCCCKGDLCNPAARPTALLSLAAVAAAIAALI